MISNNGKDCPYHEIVTKTTNLNDKEEKVPYCHKHDYEVTREIVNCQFNTNNK